MCGQDTLRVLCAEDEAHVRIVVVEALTEAGFEVIEAENGDEAIKLLELPDQFDVLFTDVRMPGKLDGIDLANHVRRDHPNFPVIITSGYAPHLNARLKDLIPPAIFIAKPYNLERVVQTLHDVSTKT